MPRREKNQREEKEFEQQIVDLARVTRVTSGGKRMRFRATLAIGDKKGRIGMGVAKGADVTIAVNKAYNQAKKKLIRVPIINETIPHQVLIKYKAAKILLKPAPKGTGIKVGGAVRIICELAGLANIRGKILGSNNKINNLRAALIAMQSFKKSAKSEKETANKEEKPIAEVKIPEDKNVNIEDKKSFKDKIKSFIKKGDK
ncbi:MAG: 30S ribosomal protein S5 [Candidatus Parcubacteria bacterium]|nr:30S ribosomal protein S5 [Candidatus Parcubacteria bacterium]